MRIRVVLLPVAGIAALVGGMVTVGDLNDNLVYYLTAEEAIERQDEFAEGRRFRLAGDVGGDEVVRQDGGASFTVEGDEAQVLVSHTGVVPRLFQSGIPVVVEGTWRGDTFHSDTMLIMHDEEYYPDEHEIDDEEQAPPADAGPEP